MECYQMKSRCNKQQQPQQQQQQETTSVSRFVIEIWKWNPTEFSKGLLVLLFCFLFAFTLLIIFKGPAAGLSDYGLFSRFLDLQPPNQATSKTNITEENYIAEDIINNITKKNYTYDKLLGGLLPEGFKESSCLSRYRWNLYRKTPPAGGGGGGRQPSSYLISKLRNYEALHKQCGPNTSPYDAAVDLLHKKKKKNNGGGHDYAACRYIIWNPPPGLGNRMLSLASAFLYALLTDRVLLLRQERGGDMSDIFCEPFLESSWLLPEYFPYGRYKIFDHSFRYRFGNMVKAHSLGKSVPPIMYINLNNHYEDNDNDKRFFCDEEQTQVQKVTWMMISSNQYFMPALFLVPSFQQELDNLFPEKQTVFHHLGRYLFHPTNAVWGLITRYYEGYLARADERIGIQIRVFNERGQKGPLKNVLEEILGCTTTENLLPKLQGGGDGEENQHAARNLAVLVTSLRPGYYEALKNMYWQNATASGEAVAFYQPSHEELQQSGNQMHDMKALAEIYLLSLTDKLVVTDWSTFGYVAYSLGGLQPWILHPPRDNTFCEHSLSMEPCLHFPPSNLVCGNNASSTVVYAKHCEDATKGLKLFDN